MNLNDKEYPSISIWGDCCIHQACHDIPHEIAFGLVSWLSVASCPSQNFLKITKEQIKKSPFSDYRKKVYYNDFTKQTLDYIFSKKTDYLIIDCNDCRKNLIVDKSEDEFSVITSFGSDTKFFLDEIFVDKSLFVEVKPYDLDFALFEKGVNCICDQILKNYSPNQIIYVVHKSVKDYFDNSSNNKFGFFPYTLYLRGQTSLNERLRQLLERIENLIFKRLQGMHIIYFPENVIGVSNHVFGLYPLHYHEFYYEYLNKALKLVFQKSEQERILLDQLLDFYSLKFKLLRTELENIFFKRQILEKLEFYQDNIKLYNIDTFDYLLNTNIFLNYLDYLYLFRHKIIILIAVKDTFGFYTDCVERQKIKKIGFVNYPKKLQHVYLGVSVNGYIVLDMSGGIGTNQEILEYNFTFNGLNIFLHSSPYIKNNQSKIIVNDIDYSLNERGINIVVLDSEHLNVIDSVSYDSHLCQYFNRKKTF